MSMQFLYVLAAISIAIGVVVRIVCRNCVRFDPNCKNAHALDLTSYELLFEDDFDGTALNTEIWSCEGKTSPRRGGFSLYIST